MQTATPASPPRPPVVIPGPSLSGGHVYYPVDLDGLVVDTVLDFNLYLESGESSHVLFRSPNLPFSVRHRNRLLDNGVRTLYVRADEHGHYAKYLEQNIGSVLANPEVPPRKKATLLYSVSRTVVRDAFDEPRSSAIVPRTRHLATETVDFVLQSERALAQLASIMATDYYTYTHSINVCVFVVALAHQCGVARADIEELAVGALLHDLGKSRVPKELLNKSGDLTADELALIRKHVEWGEELVAQHTQLSPVVMLPVALHHERLDGTGYPRRLPGDQIHLFGRITALADCYDAMTTKRSYQRAMTGYEALHCMQTVLRGKFDDLLLDKFIRMLRRPDSA
jgi:putative nucleotidyltransferase with HDIG domain